MSTINELDHQYTIGVIACGTMGTAVLNAIVSSLDKPEAASTSAPVPGKFLATVNSKSSVERLNGMFGSKVEVTIGNNEEVVKNSDLIILACKPFLADAILSAINKEYFKGKTVISLLAGKTIAQLTALTDATVARAMTNTPSKIGAGMTIVSLPPVDVPESVKETISWIFNNTGRCLFMDEKYMDVATALCGSGPAFCFLMIEALSDGAVKMGMPYNVAQECAAQVLHGASQMVLEGNHPAVLRNAVCTPGGTTIGGLSVLENAGVRGLVASAVVEATNIATALSKK